MERIMSSYKKTFKIAGFGIFLLIVLSVFNQINEIYIFVSSFHPVVGKIMLLLLSAVFIIIFSIPIAGFIKLRKPIAFPDINNREAYEKYLKRLRKRLQKNIHIKNSDFRFQDEENILLQINKALEILNEKAVSSIKNASSTIFITTAVSQNGVLDSFFVLTSLSKMIWEISHIYNQRPRIGDIFSLYVNVAGTVILARGIEDALLLEEQIQPVLNTVLGGTVGNLPGVNILISSIMEGSANAFLALRVGIIAKNYSSSVTEIDKSALKKSSVKEAVSLLGTLVQENTLAISKAFASAAKKATVDKTIGAVKTGAVKTFEGLKNATDKINEAFFGKSDEEPKS